MRARRARSQRGHAEDRRSPAGPWTGGRRARIGLELLEERTLLAVGLVAAYDFGEGSGTTVLDSSGSTNHGQITGAVWTTAGKYGGALSFNGSSAKVAIPDSNSLDLTTGMTLEAWVRPAALSDWATVVLKERTGGLAYAMYATDGPSRPPSGYINRSGTDVSAVGASALALNTWTHLATTYDGATLRFYVNGALVRSRATTGSIATSTGPLDIGGNSVWGEFYSGLIDEVRVYNRALSAAEVQADMNTPIVSTPDTTAPTVAVTAPANGATVSGTTTVTAGASDNVGVVGVQFKLDGVNLGAEDTTAPYSVSWNSTGVADGPHTLTAIARDAANNVTTSAQVVVTVSNVDSAAPTVSLTAPANGATVSGTTTVAASASDNVGVLGVQFKLDGVNLGAEDTTAPYSISWNTTGVANGPHTLTAIARDAANNVTTSAQVVVTVSNVDATAPTVSLTAPASGATVSATATLTATASDNVGVVGVQFLLDGAPLGAEDTTLPYSLTWDTTASANGSHTVAARARDAAGNVTTSTTRTVTVSNASSADPAQVGQWSAVMSWPLIAINAVLLNNGKVLLWDGGPDCIGAITATVWDPASNTFSPVPSELQPDVRDLFCSGQTVLGDGRVLVVGGHECDDPNFTGLAMTNIFDPVTQQWTDGPDMAYRRWYPTVITRPDGRALVIAGSDRTVTSYIPIPEIYDPVTNSWTKLSAANLAIPNYPFVFNLPDGRVLVAGSDEAKMASYVLDVASQTWSVVDPTVLDAGSAVMYAPGKVMKAGSSYLSPPLDNGGNVPSSAKTYVLDMTQSSPAWQQSASMAYPRTHLNLTVLPDGNVLATGGSTVIGGIDPATGVLPAEMWNPASRTWTTMSSMSQARLYHSTALLLPDGRVLVAGSGHNYANSYVEYSAEIYSPPYLFKGPRPTITSAPSTVAYGSSVFVATPDAAAIASVSLIRDGSVTHSFNMDQQYTPLTFRVVSGGLMVDVPASANAAAPGYYMLYIVNANGVPAVAPIVRVMADTQAPTAPTNLTAAASGGTVTLNWTAATDNFGIVRYNVHRATTPNFVPSSANRIGQPTTTSFLDSGLAAGTYYYKVTAQDAGGNVGATSNEATATVAVAPIRVVQHAANGFEWSVPNISLSFPTNNTAGSFLIVTGTAARPAETMTITDTAGNTYIPAIGPVTDPAQAVTAYVWYVVNAVGGPNTVTLTPSDGEAHAMEIHISEWTGVSKISPVDQVSYATGFGTQITSGVVTTTQPGDLIFGYTFPNGSATAGAGFAGLSLVNGDLDEYLIQSTAGPVAATFTQQSNDWFALVVAFKPEVADQMPPSAPGNLSAIAISESAIGLSWAPATDNVAVTGYNVYRSTTPGFTPSAVNLIAQVTGTTFTDDGLPPGSFFYRVAARDAVGNVGPPSNEASATVAGDVSPPTVSLSAPAGGATVTGTVTVTANASDNVSVAGVQFLLDGVNLGAEDTTAPFSLVWNTAAVANGSHTLTASARDAAGNRTTSAAIAVTVTNAPATGLVGAWGFEEGTGTTVGDASGHGLNGTLTSAAWTASGKFGKALSFNGTSAWVTVADNTLLHLTNGMTLEAWVKPATASTDWSAAILKERTGGLAYALYTSDGANRPPAGYINRSGSDVKAAGTSVLALNTWSHLAATYDGATIRLFVNGVQVGSRAQAGNITSSTSPLRFGGNAVWGEYFNGLIDEVRIYSRALTTAEIQADMTAPIGGGSGALAAAGGPGGAPTESADLSRAVPPESGAWLTTASLSPLVDEAIRRWEGLGASPSQLDALRKLNVTVADLVGGQLGFTSDRQIWIDRDAAGHGWLIDPTPAEDSEFLPGGPAAGMFDLLTVLVHEMGHALGYGHSVAPGDVMQEALPPGVRRIALDPDDVAEPSQGGHGVVQGQLPSDQMTLPRPGSASLLSLRSRPLALGSRYPRFGPARSLVIDTGRGLMWPYPLVSNPRARKPLG